MTKKSKTADDLFHDTLKDIYYAEKKILKALPKMRRAAHSDDLATAFEDHQSETEDQIQRLEKVFELIEKTPRGKTCEAIEGLIAEAEEIIADYKDTEALDAGLIAAAQAVEHYEIARYGTLRAWAGALGLDEAKELLTASLDEESATDEKLTSLSVALGFMDPDKEAA